MRDLPDGHEEVVAGDGAPVQPHFPPGVRA